LREWRNKTLDFVVNCACADCMQQRLGLKGFEIEKPC